MNLSRIFIERPVMTALVCFAILLFGTVAFRGLPVAALPSVDYPTIQVSAAVPGANPETMASSVATPLEKQFSTIAGIQSMSSSNSQGSTTITVQFDLSRNIDAAAQDIQAAISAAGGQSAAQHAAPAHLSKVNPAEQPIYYLAITSATLPLLQGHRLRRYPAGRSASPWWAAFRACRFSANRSTPSACRWIRTNLRRTISASTKCRRPSPAPIPICPPAVCRARSRPSPSNRTARSINAAAYRPLIVAYRNGAPVRLEQLGNVVDGVENDRQIAWINDIALHVSGHQQTTRHQYGGSGG